MEFFESENWSSWRTLQVKLRRKQRRFAWLGALARFAHPPPTQPTRLFLFAYFPIAWLDETLISSRFLLWHGFPVLLFWRFVLTRRLFKTIHRSFSSHFVRLCFTGVVYGSLISTQNNATGAKVFSENEQFNHMAGHKKRHEANRQHPSNLPGKFSTCEPNLTHRTRRDDGVCETRIRGCRSQLM
jgi:hypothetical protein